MGLHSKMKNLLFPNRIIHALYVIFIARIAGTVIAVWVKDGKMKIVLGEDEQTCQVSLCTHTVTAHIKVLNPWKEQKHIMRLCKSTFQWQICDLLALFNLAVIQYSDPQTWCHQLYAKYAIKLQTTCLWIQKKTEEETTSFSSICLFYQLTFCVCVRVGGQKHSSGSENWMFISSYANTQTKL